MIIRNCDVLTMTKACADVGVDLAYDPYTAEGGLRVRFVPYRDEHYKCEHGHYRYQRRSASMFHTERRIHALCWHGHRELFRKILELCPGAKIYTAPLRTHAMAERCYTVHNFEALHPSTGTINIGSQAFPIQAREACFCSETMDDYDSRSRVKTEVLK